MDVYPYYPEFLNHQPEYLEPDSNGNINPYRAYLKELRGEYSVPVVVAEYGVPSSRGSAHTAVSGFDQGGITEEEQGEAIVSMMRSIAGEKYAGSLIFSWQDEWFKQTWNTVKYSPENADARTPNVQSAEQSYGLLAMEAGEETLCLIDGKRRRLAGRRSRSAGQCRRRISAMGRGVFIFEGGNAACFRGGYDSCSDLYNAV